MLTRFRLHDHAFTRMKVLGMPLAVLETLLKQGVSRPLNTRCWEFSSAEGQSDLGGFSRTCVLVSSDGKVLDIQNQPYNS